jgi:hypothetical protein
MIYLVIKVMKFGKKVQTIIVISLVLIIIQAWFIWQIPDTKRAKFCTNAQPLTQVKVQNYDANGVRFRQGTFTRKVAIKNEREIKIIIFPQALAPKTWIRIPQSSIKYIGKGGDNSWKEWLRPDYFYLLTVPTQATALAFGRLCYRNGDVEVESVKQVKQRFWGRIIINNEINLSVPFLQPRINQDSIIVNTGSNRLDILGTQTEVYFTVQNIKLDEKSL